MKSFLKKMFDRLLHFRKTGMILFCIFFGVLFSCSLIKNSKKKYSIACPTEWSTIELFSQDKQVTGFLSDVMQDISINEGIEIRLNFVRETEAKALVNEGICDGYFSAMPKTFSSEKQYYFSTPLFNSGYLIVVMNDSPLKNLEDCIDANIGVTRDSLNRILPFLRPSWRAYIYDTTSLALEDVKQRRIDGVLIDSLALQILFTGRYSNEFRPLYPSLTPHEIRVVTLKTPKGAELIGSIDKGSAHLKEKGLIEKHLQYWGITSLNNLGDVK